MDYIAEISSELGIVPWLLIVIIVWSLFWKLTAMWKSAKNNHVIWFVVIALFNTIGILPILYIYVFSDLGDFKENNLKNPKFKKKPKKKSKRR
jgi:hypothetical protein